MFRRPNEGETPKTDAATGLPLEATAQNLVAATLAPAPFKPELPQPRSLNIPGLPGTTKKPERVAAEPKRRIVGKDISLSGEITACDYLIVEGTVDARVREGQSLEIAESGLFRGNVTIQQADIAGSFEGELTVKGRLTIRSSGVITGQVKYGELEIEAGGQIYGTITGPNPKAEKLEKGEKVAKSA